MNTVVPGADTKTAGNCGNERAPGTGSAATTKGSDLMSGGNGTKKKTISEILADPDVNNAEKLKIVQWQNQRLSEYCHVMRDTLVAIEQDCAKVVERIPQDIAPPSIPDLVNTFTMLGVAASKAHSAKPKRQDRAPGLAP